MLDRLLSGDEGSVESLKIFEVLHEILALLNEPLNGLTRFAPRGLLPHFEHLLQAFDLNLRLVTMLIKGLAELIRLRGFRHFRQGSQNLLLGVIHVLQGIQEKISRVFCFAGIGISLQVIPPTDLLAACSRTLSRIMDVAAKPRQPAPWAGASPCVPVQARRGWKRCRPGTRHWRSPGDRGTIGRTR
jgi:hypothetical protein